MLRTSLSQMDLPLVFAIFVIRNTLLRGPLPPGPYGIPLLGNALNMAKPRPWIKYTEWSRQYGEYIPFSQWFCMTDYC